MKYVFVFNDQNYEEKNGIYFSIVSIGFLLWGFIAILSGIISQYYQNIGFYSLIGSYFTLILICSGLIFYLYMLICFVKGNNQSNYLSLSIISFGIGLVLWSIIAIITSIIDKYYDSLGEIIYFGDIVVLILSIIGLVFFIIIFIQNSINDK